jgi:FkbM family methyltransferase
MLTDLIKSWTRQLGIDLIKYPPLSTLARQLREFLRTNDINLVIDIGAADGDYCRFLRGPVEYSGQIVSFEPTKTTFEKLSLAMAGDGAWRGFNVGVSDADGTTEFNTYGDNYDFNSMLNLRKKDADIYGIDLSKKRTEQIKLRSIASIWPEITNGMVSPNAYLKTDTQGHDQAVIKGSEPCLSSIRGMQSEIAAIQIYDGMVPMSDMLRYLDGLGYFPIGFHPINQPAAYDGGTPEFDVVFKRR